MFYDFCIWIIIHLGAALAALFVALAWLALIFVTVDEGAAAYIEHRNNKRKTPNTQDGDL